MRRILAIPVALLLVFTAGAQDRLLQSSGLAPSQVDAEGGLVEDWGRLVLRLEQPAEATVTEQRYDASPVPAAFTTWTAGPLVLTETAYRAPIWPGGVDVLESQILNAGTEGVDVRLAVDVPEGTQVGDRVGVLGGRPVLAMPKDLEPVREELSWGHTGGLTPLPGWAQPQGECDPAFRNISAGMGGTPIVYRFAVPAGAARTVVLGFCESFHSAALKRPLVARVEGAPDQEIDPVGAWGRHVPGGLSFLAKDENQDGRLEVAVLPHPKAEDKNPILNALWVFAPETAVDVAQAVRGTLNGAAEYFVDVGGEKDQLLYKSGKVLYEFRLEPGARQDLLFLVACPGGGPVPDPRRTAWTAASLRKAGAEVASGWKESAPQ
jgi:hypothetical protein